MTGENLPSFLQDNPWVDILSQRGNEHEPFSAHSAPQPEEKRLKPTPQPRPPTDTSVKELLTELKQLLQSFRIQQTVVQPSQPTVIVIPIYIPLLPGMLYPPASSEPVKEGSKQLVLCPKCGRYGTINICTSRRGGKERRYIYIYHGNGERCYVGGAHQIDELLMNFDERGRPHEKAHFELLFGKAWSLGRDLNPGPPPYQGGALTRLGYRGTSVIFWRLHLNLLCPTKKS